LLLGLGHHMEHLLEHGFHNVLDESHLRMFDLVGLAVVACGDGESEALLLVSLSKELDSYSVSPRLGKIEWFASVCKVSTMKDLLQQKFSLR